MLQLFLDVDHIYNCVCCFQVTRSFQNGSRSNEIIMPARATTVLLPV